jgi:TM2 domain-containing membrane protein YozV
MKVCFKRFFCLGMALLFLSGLSNFSGNVKASEPSNVNNGHNAVTHRSASGGNVVITKKTIEEEAADQNTEQDTAKSPADAGFALFLAFFFGDIGLHRFYVGKIGTGLARIGLTLAALKFGGLLWCAHVVIHINDIVSIMLEDFKDCNGLPVKF